MFHNTNTGIVKKLAGSSLKADRRRNLFIIITIAFTACLMMTLAMKVLGENTKQSLYLRGRYQVLFTDVDREQIGNLKADPKVEAAGTAIRLCTPRRGDYTLDVHYMDPEAMSLLSYPAVEGEMPREENEIVADAGLLEHLGMEARAGQGLTMDLGDGEEKEYAVSGILNRDISNKIYTVAVSEAYIEKLYSGKPPYTVHIRLADSEGLNMEELKLQAQELGRMHGVLESNIFYSSTYFLLGEDLPIEKVMLILAVCALIVLASALVIYSLFYISVIGKTQEYGRLRVIGTTRKQIGKIVRREGLLLSLAALPVGELVGCLIGYLLTPEGFTWKTTVWCVLVTVLFTEAAVLISLHKPVKLAARVSPVEAVRANSFTDHGKKPSQSRQGRRINAFRLAWLNFTRNKKKAVLTLASLGFSGILLVCVSAYVNSMDAEEMARRGFGLGEIRVELSQGENTSDADITTMAEFYTGIQDKALLSEEFISQLEELDGVEKADVFQGCYSDMIFPSNPGEIVEDSFRNIALSREQMETYGQNLIEGTADYDTLVKENGILFRDNENLIKRYYGYQPRVGDTVSIVTDTGEVKEFKIMGQLSDFQVGIDIPFFFLPQDLLPGLKTQVSQFNTHVMLTTTPEKTKQLESEVIRLIQDKPDLKVSFLSDLSVEMEKSINNIKAPLYGLVLFITIFGLINLVNTLLTNVVTRQREFGILQSTGMTRKQLSRMLQTEGLMYVGGTLLVTLVAGGAASWGLCRIFDQLGTFGKLNYRFPAGIILLFAAFLLVIEFLYAVSATRYCNKSSLITQINL